jgi:hypothetical protein
MRETEERHMGKLQTHIPGTFLMLRIIIVLQRSWVWSLPEGMKSGTLAFALDTCLRLLQCMSPLLAQSGRPNSLSNVRFWG